MVSLKHTVQVTEKGSSIPEQQASGNTVMTPDGEGKGKEKRKKKRERKRKEKGKGNRKGKRKRKGKRARSDQTYIKFSTATGSILYCFEI